MPLWGSHKFGAKKTDVCTTFSVENRLDGQFGGLAIRQIDIPFHLWMTGSASATVIVSKHLNIWSIACKSALCGFIYITRDNNTRGQLPSFVLLPKEICLLMLDLVMPNMHGKAWHSELLAMKFSPLISRSMTDSIKTGSCEALLSFSGKLMDAKKLRNRFAVQ